MLRRIESVSSYQLAAKDGRIGHLHDFYFDAQHWALRYFVVDTRAWIHRNKALVSPIGVEAVDWTRRVIVVNLTKDQIRNGPSVDAARPVSRRHEAVFNAYYGYSAYWPGPGVWAEAATPARLAGDARGRMRADFDLDDPDAPHLRSANEVSSCHIEAIDQKIGHAKDFVLDDETWVIRYVIVDTGNWLGERLVVLAPQWIEAIEPHGPSIHVNMTSQDVRESPEFDPSSPDRTIEQRLNVYYDRVLEHRRHQSGALSK